MEIFFKIFINSTALFKSSAEVGSSKSKIFASCANALANNAFCNSPPDRVSIFLSFNSLIFNKLIFFSTIS